MKTFRNSDLVRAGRLIPNRATLCYHILAGKTLHGKNKYGGPGSAKSVNISLKFEVHSTLTLPVKCPLTKLGES